MGGPSYLKNISIYLFLHYGGVNIHLNLVNLTNFWGIIEQAENGLQLRSSENGKTVRYGLVWFDMVWYGFVGIVWYGGWGQMTKFLHEVHTWRNFNHGL